MNKFEENIEDRSAIFIEYDGDDRSPQKQAREFYKNLLGGTEDNNEQELYSASLCEIKDSTEAHYININNEDASY